MFLNVAEAAPRCESQLLHVSMICSMRIGYANSQTERAPTRKVQDLIPTDTCGSHSGWHMRISFFDMAPTEDIQSPPTWEARRDLTPTDTVGLILTMAITRTGAMRTNFGANKMSDMKERSLLPPSPAWRRRRRSAVLCCWQLFGFGDKWRDSSSREQKRKPNFIINFVVIFSRQLLARSFLG